MNVLSLTRLWPNASEPNHAIFNEHRARAMASLPGVSITAVAPVPYCPSGPLPERYAKYARVPMREVRFGIPVEHPRYPVVPKVGLRLQGPGLVLATMPLIGRLVRQHSIDVIDGHFLYPDGLAAVEAGRRFGVPVVVTACGNDVYGTPRQPGIRPIVRRVIEGATMLVAVSRSLAAGLVELGADPGKIVVIPYGVDTATFSRTPEGRQSVRTKLGVAPDEPLLVAVGRLHPVKAHDLLIEAMARVKGRPRLVIVGEGDYRPVLEALIRQKGLEKRITLVGAVPNRELASWYSAADLFCLPSRAEGHPNVLIEALSCGAPAVAAAVGAVSEMIVPSCGLVVPPEDLGALVRAIDAGLSAVRERLWTSEAARSAVSHRGWGQVAQETLSVLTEARGRFSDGRHAARATT